MRSFKLPYPKAAIAPRVNTLLTELGVSSSRLVMPTATNCQHLESLMDAATNLVELKRVLDKVDQDIDVLKSRLQIREEGGDGASVDAMDNDDRAETVEPEGETGRSQSVMSARSTRGRKNVSLLLLHFICTEWIIRLAVPCPFLPWTPLRPVGRPPRGRSAYNY